MDWQVEEVFFLQMQFNIQLYSLIKPLEHYSKEFNILNVKTLRAFSNNNN